MSREDARLEYTGDTLVSTGSTSTSSTAPVRMSAVVTEDQDGALGSRLGSTDVKFTLSDINGNVKASCTGAVAPQPSTGKGTAGCTLSGITAGNYTVQMVLQQNGWYQAPVENAAVTVANSGTGFTTGGGWFTEPQLGTRSNFGFTAKYLKNGGVQGNSLYIYRRVVAAGSVANPTGGNLPAGEYNWIIKSNSMTALSQSHGPTCPTTAVCKSTFTGKSNVTAVNRATGVAFSLGGNRQFQVDVTDLGEPGSKSAPVPDTYALRVWDSSGTYYQVGSPTAQRALTGGNIQVRP